MKHAFTLIELLIVVAIIGILAAIAVPNFLNAQIRAKVARTVSDMKALVDGFQMYYLDRGDWVPDYDGLGLGSGFGSEARTYYALTTPVAYMNQIPLDVWVRTDQFVEIQGKKEKFYEYWGHRSGDDTRFLLSKKYNIGYIMRSIGPDLQLQGAGWEDFGERRYGWAYHPSNGLNSLGDFVATNRGVENQL